jgi:hypothetical protein
MTILIDERGYAEINGERWITLLAFIALMQQAGTLHTHYNYEYHFRTHLDTQRFEDTRAEGYHRPRLLARWSSWVAYQRRRFGLPLSEVEDRFTLREREVVVIDGKRWVTTRTAITKILFHRGFTTISTDTLSKYGGSGKIARMKIRGNSWWYLVDSTEQMTGLDQIERVGYFPRPE